MEELLLEPINIGPMTVSNRIVMPAMHLNYTMGGEITDQFIEFYKARAVGGTGLIIIGGASIDEIGGGPFLVGLYDDKFIPGLARFVKEARQGEGKLAVQLYHAGRYSFSWYTQQQPIAPSPVGSPYNPEIPREMTIEDIEKVQESFVHAAVRAVEAGFDAVEIVGSAGYLVAQFLSTASNKRTDEYGGSFENRARFGMEVISKIRQAVGDSTAVIIRVAGSDFVPGGHSNIESAQAAKLFEQAGAQAINVTGGWHESRVPQITMGVPEGAYSYLAAGIKRNVSVPVISSNRLGNPLMAAEVLANGHADMIAMGRPLIADANIVQKIRERHSDSIRPCIACNQGCFDNVFQGLPVHCVLNPTAGYEKERVVQAAKNKKTVAVVGAGPAGVEAARVAAQRGHKVILFEQQDRIGGALHYAGAPPGRFDFYRLIEYLENELMKGQISLRLGTSATVELVKSENPDVVIVATGSAPVIPGFLKESKHENQLLAEDVLSGGCEIHGDAVVIGGGSVGAETALYIAQLDMITPEVAAFLLVNNAETPERVKELLTRAQRKITVCDLLPGIAQDMGKTTRWTIMQDLRRHGVELRTRTEVVCVEERGVRVKSADGVEDFLECGTVVVAVGYKANNALAQEMEKAGLNVKVIGDAVTPRKIMEAIHEGFLVAAAI
jgi:2,4-dienoyl-CoA reductase (NADPH2)